MYMGYFTTIINFRFSMFYFNRYSGWKKKLGPELNAEIKIKSKCR